MNGIDGAALDRWITRGDYHEQTNSFVCQACGAKFDCEVAIEYGRIISDVACPDCESEEVEAE